MKEPAHRALHPFGKIPTYEEGDLALFETGAIVLFIAERHAGLLPKDANARARAITWMFAALNTVEPPILELANARLLEGDKPWTQERCLWSWIASASRWANFPLAWATPTGSMGVQRGRPDDGVGTARLRASGILHEFPNLAAYVARGEARPAYKRAFDAQLGGLPRHRGGEGNICRHQPELMFRARSKIP